ncbi:uncharacterized protein LOC108739237 [Agrilus planipennis]|uniref:Uncharacterized protein LOC108739237 n=1 Tax=Agrilus planipennis TaxID=224129 RepID=A0A1W4WXE3_AGRPL|nr:uncharacterized protein LOC108739237 [Agrilus planipennis]
MATNTTTKIISVFTTSSRLGKSTSSKFLRQFCSIKSEVKLNLENKQVVEGNADLQESKEKVKIELNRTAEKETILDPESTTTVDEYPVRAESSVYKNLKKPLKKSRLAPVFPEPVKVMPSDTISDQEKAQHKLEACSFNFHKNE